VNGVPCAPAADLNCIVCGKPLEGTGLAKAALMFDALGQPKGWAHPHHGIDLPRVIRRETEKVMCARCKLPLVGEHGVTQGEAWCRDGGPFVLAEESLTEVITLEPAIAGEHRRSA
jgi:hypothetical protein